MGIPGEDIVSTAIDKFADGVMKKMDEDEERRDREFTYRMKELDFYKNSYEQEIKRIFDDWFTLLQDSLLSIIKI